MQNVLLYHTREAKNNLYVVGQRASLVNFVCSGSFPERPTQRQSLVIVLSAVGCNAEGSTVPLVCVS